MINTVVFNELDDGNVKREKIGHLNREPCMNDLHRAACRETIDARQIDAAVNAPVGTLKDTQVKSKDVLAQLQLVLFLNEDEYKLLTGAFIFTPLPQTVTVYPLSGGGTSGIKTHPRNKERHRCSTPASQ